MDDYIRKVENSHVAGPASVKFLKRIEAREHIYGISYCPNRIFVKHLVCPAYYFILIVYFAICFLLILDGIGRIVLALVALWIPILTVSQHTADAFQSILNGHYLYISFCCQCYRKLFIVLKKRDFMAADQIFLSVYLNHKFLYSKRDLWCNRDRNGIPKTFSTYYYIHTSKVLYYKIITSVRDYNSDTPKIK